MSPKLLNILLIMLPVSLYYGYIEPVYTGQPGFVWTPESSIMALQAENVEYKNAFNQIEAIENEINKLNGDYIAINQDLKNKVNMLLPSEINEIKLRNEVNSIASKMGIAISNLTVLEITRQTAPKLKGYKVSFSVKGHYIDLKKMFERYEKSTRLFILSSISIKKSFSDQIKEDDDVQLLDAIVSYDVYYLK